MLYSVFMLALQSVQRNMLRSFLTILGIVIGVSAVVTMVTLGNGATESIRLQISGLGTNLLMVTHEADMAAYARRMVTFVDGRIARDVANANPVTGPPVDIAPAPVSAPANVNASEVA